MLLRHGVSLGRRERSIHPLNIAIIRSNFAAAIELVDNGALNDEKVCGVAGAASTPLLIATTLGAKQMVELLWERGASPRASRGEITPLHEAAVSSFIEVLRHLLVNGAPIDARDPKQQTPLHWAGAHGAAQAASMLLLHGAQVDALDEVGSSPLFCAMRERSVKAVSTLLGRGADFHSCGSLLMADGSLMHGFTPLCFASTIGETKMVKILLEKGANANKADIFGVSPLGHASRKGYLKVMGALRRRGAEVTPLCLRLAVDAGQGKALEFLLGGRMPAESNLGRKNMLASEMIQSMLCEACGEGCARAVKASLSNGATMRHGPDRRGLAALCSAARFNQHGVMSFLLERGPSIEAPKWAQASALHAAAQMGNSKAIDSMLECGWSSDSRDSAGSSPLIVASLHNDHNDSSLILRLLIKQGAHIGLRNARRASAARCAAWSGSRMSLRHLLEEGCPIDAQSEDGWAPLHIVATEGWASMAADLLLLGADLEIRDSNGDAPLLLATKKGHRNAAATLLGRGAIVNIKSK